MHRKVEDLEERIRVICRKFRAVQADQTIFDDPDTMGMLVCTLGEETQTRWFLF